MRAGLGAQVRGSQNPSSSLPGLDWSPSAQSLSPPSAGRMPPPRHCVLQEGALRPRADPGCLVLEVAPQPSPMFPDPQGSAPAAGTFHNVNGSLGSIQQGSGTLDFIFI